VTCKLILSSKKWKKMEKSFSETCPVSDFHT
jgi:hypothetical protein